jgi:formylglycine-generating enzyme required for sulfatase activity
MIKGLGIAAFTVMLVLMLTGCKEPEEPPPPADSVINIAAIQGVTAPTNGGIPITAITANAQYGGTVTWSPNNSTFAASIVYMAIITLIPKSGYTLQGVPANFFMIVGAVLVSNAANSGIVTAVFPATIAGGPNFQELQEIVMVYVPGGSFQMGDVKNEGWNDERPVHTVTLTGFYMSKHEVTQAQYEAIMGTNPSDFNSNPAAGEIQGNRPVECVSWYDAIVFCNKLSIFEGLTPAYRISGSTNPSDWGIVPTSGNSAWNAVEIVGGSNGYRLPTEAQWEYAAKGGNGSPGNYTYSGSDTVGNVAWYYENSSSKTHEVGKKSPNGLGIYDMSGNVYEWCWDWFGEYSGAEQTDPAGAVTGSNRVLRGGYWGSNGQYLRSAHRVYVDPSRRHFYLGFRLVRS